MKSKSKPTIKRRRPRHCKYIVRPDGRETFITRQAWARCVTPDKARPLSGHLIIATAAGGTAAFILRVPQPHRGFCRGRPLWKVEQDAWFKLVDRLELEWWDYLTPSVLPPTQPKKKYYTEAELSRGHIRLQIIVNDQEV